ncbi:1-phosphofructokinase family hexose kinase [Nigerium massiliense]|uniref:1-phosphofructokinase family hexose kinase n=1 Tax=Nigerium massiliense TaxID=1522317 RepID=UPI00058FD558|nr:1-phosphofructokinase family hexose kinase [Nigerium massiliense]
MIVTFTPNPSMDKTVSLPGPLQRGEVMRVVAVLEQAAGKGVNVARVLAASGEAVRTVLPFRDEAYLAALTAELGGDPLLEAVDPGPAGDAPAHRARTNTAVTEPDGTTTKINEPGPQLSEQDVRRATSALADHARDASWVVLSGSLPPGAPTDWYARMVTALRPTGCKIAIDTSDDPLAAVIAGLPAGSFDLLKPNSVELAQLTGGDGAAFEAAAARGEVAEIVEAARSLQSRGITNVLVTLGGAGAVLVTADGAWAASAPAVDVLSTVGAGDSSVAGFVLADVRGEDPGQCLANAVAYGSAAAGLPGTTLPTPQDVRRDDAAVRRLP